MDVPVDGTGYSVANPPPQPPPRPPRATQRVPTRPATPTVPLTEPVPSPSPPAASFPPGVPSVAGDTASMVTPTGQPLLEALVAVGGSDLHLKANVVPRVRVDGVLRNLKFAPLSAGEFSRLIGEIVRDDLRGGWDRGEDVDFAVQVSGVGRFRVNAYRQRGEPAVVFRKVLLGAPRLETLHVPDAVAELSLKPRGLVLVTGPTGSGKTTTLAGMIDLINESKDVHIITVEDPIEIVHEEKRALLSQREVNVDTPSFLEALRSAMRQDPDVILVGEMRDAVTVRTALQAAETGHLVLSTLHTINSQETVSRILDFFPPHEQQQVRFTLSQSLQGIVCQRLVPHISGVGRLPVVEVCVNTSRVAEAIADPEKTSTIESLVGEGGLHGMQTFDQHLLDLVRKKNISVEQALETASKRHDVEVGLRKMGVIL